MWIAAIIGAVAGGIGASSSKTAASRSARKQRKILLQQMQFYQSIWADYKKKYGSLEDKMIGEVKRGLSYQRFTDAAQEDVQSGFDRVKDIGQRRMERYGLTPAGGGFEQNMRNLDSLEAKTVAGARNRARNYVTDTNFNRRVSALNFGSSLRSAAIGGIGNASFNLAGLYGADAARQGAASNEYAQGAIGNLGTAIGAMFDNNGGKQNTRFGPINDQQTQNSKNYMQGWNGFTPTSKKGWLGDYYGGDSGVKNFAKGGLVEGIVDSVAGYLTPRNADKTVQMRNLYKQYNIEAQTSGQPVSDWGQWLNQQGYELTQDGQVMPMEAPATPQNEAMKEGLFRVDPLYRDLTPEEAQRLASEQAAAEASTEKIPVRNVFGYNNGGPEQREALSNSFPTEKIKNSNLIDEGKLQIDKKTEYLTREEIQDKIQALKQAQQNNIGFRNGGPVDAYVPDVGEVPAYNDGGTVDAYAHTAGATPAYAAGGPIASGLSAMSPNQVTGPGGVDKVPAMIDGKRPAKLSSGEFVMSREATMHHGLKRLDAMNDEWKKDKTTGGA